jgi:hypothetical protein
MKTTINNRFLHIITIMTLLINIGFAEADMKPKNYSEIKAILDFYATADDMMDDRLIAARESLRVKGDEAIPALLILFKENTDDRYRFAIVDAIQHNKGSKKSSVSFLLNQLQAKGEFWDDKYWISKTIEFLTTADPTQARLVACKALNTNNDYIKHAAINSLAEVGTAQDVEKLSVFREQRKSLKQGLNDEVLNGVNAAIKRIEERSSHK